MNGYFDNAATTYRKPAGMYEYISEYMLQYGANVGRGGYESSRRGGTILFEMRSKLLGLMNAPATKAVVIAPSATVALNTILYGLNLKKDDVVYISHFEHNAILRPLFDLEQKIGIHIEFLPMSATEKYSFDLVTTEKVFASSKPKAVIVSHVSNVLGLISPIEKIAGLAKKYGAVMIVDGAQSCSIIDCNLVNIDFYVFAGHKTLLGPTGIGGFICNKNTSLAPLILGGTGVDSASKEMPATIPERYEAGTVNLMSVVGLNYSLDWIMKNKTFMREAECKNVESLYRILTKYEFLQIVSPYPRVSGIISCRAKGYTSDEFGRILADNGIAVRTGLHCAPEAHKYSDSFPEGLIRFSVSCFTGTQDFDLLEQSLDKISLEI